MKYGKAAIITPKHTAFVWNKNKQQMSIPDEQSNNIKHIYLAKEFTCILNLSNEAVCIKDETDTIVHQESKVDKIICEEKFMCQLLTDGTFKCKAFEDKYNVLIPKFPENLKMADLDIKVNTNFKQMVNSKGPFTNIYKKKNGDEFIPDQIDNSQGTFESQKIVYCIISKNSKIECQINIAFADCKDCNQSQKIEFGQQIKATDYIIHDQSVCLRDQYSWYCYSYEIDLYLQDLTSTKITTKQEFQPTKFEKSFIDQLYKSPKIMTIAELPKGVQHNVPFDYFKDWKILYQADWSSKTKTTDIDKPVDGEILFVGAYKKSSDTIYMGAFGLRNEIVKRTYSNQEAVYQDNDVYWQQQEGMAFGFSDKQKINLNQGWQDQDERNSNNNKLSFAFQNNNGGGRAGNGILSTTSTDWVKVIYYKPRSTQSEATDTETESKYMLDYASDGDSSCELGDALEISCQNFPKPISLYRDTVKQATEKQVEEYIAQYHLKVDDSAEETTKNESSDKDYDDDIQQLNDEIEKLEKQNIAIAALEKHQEDLKQIKDNQESQNVKIGNLSAEITNLKNSPNNSDSNTDEDFTKQKTEINSSIEAIQTKFSELEKDVIKNKSKIASNDPISDDDINKIKTELAETKAKLKSDLSTDADILFDQRIKKKIISDEYLNKILELSLDNKLVNLNTTINSIKTKVDDQEQELRKINSSNDSKDPVNDEQLNKNLELKMENNLNKYEIAEINKTLRMLIQIMIVVTIVLVSVIVQLKFQDIKAKTINKESIQSTNQQVDMNLEDESGRNQGYVNRMN